MKKLCTLQTIWAMTLLLMCSFSIVQCMQKTRRALKQIDEKTRKKNEQNLVRAAHDGNITKVNQLVMGENTDVNATAFKTTPLAQAAQEGHLAIVHYLIAQKGQVNHARPDGATPVLLASEKGQNDVVKFLLEKNANPNQSDLKFATPLHQACDEHHVATNLLLQARANPNQSDATGATPVIFASQAGKLSIVSLLLGAKALTDSQTHDEYGFTALTQASKFGHNCVVQLLLEVNAQVNKPRRRHTKTALHLATKKNHVTVVNTLLHHGADKNLLDSTSKKAIDYAKTDDMKKIFTDDEIKREA